MRVVSLWSGGKDSCFACYKAALEGYDVVSLFNFTDFKGRYSLSHGLPAGLIQKQGACVKISFFQKAMPKETYTEEFVKLTIEWKIKKNIEGIVFGDIYLEEHKDWIDKVCKAAGVKPIMPLWRRETKDLIVEFINSGFKAIVVAANSSILGKDWLGLPIDRGFLEKLKEKEDIDPCGEKGEFHTFVYDGPIFEKPVAFTMGNKILKDNHWFLELFPKR